MISVETINEYLIKGKATSVKRAILNDNKSVIGCYVYLDGTDYDFFIADSDCKRFFTHSGSKLLEHGHPWRDRILYVHPWHVTFVTLGVKV